MVHNNYNVLNLYIIKIVRFDMCVVLNNLGEREKKAETSFVIFVDSIDLNFIFFCFISIDKNYLHVLLLFFSSFDKEKKFLKKTPNQSKTTSYTKYNCWKFSQPIEFEQYVLTHFISLTWNRIIKNVIFV
jgi:hypothetical protein